MEQPHFIFAAQNGHKEICKMIIDEDVKTNSKNIFVMTPLDYAANNGHNEIILMLQSSNVETMDIN